MVADIVVSVCCWAFNQARFIRDALDGFIMQATSFPIEIVIHDDASTDGTSDIIREYEKRYPEVILPIYQTENQYSKGVRISATYVFPKARGKYIALCEGDDYWTDPLKLQKQVDFLDAHPECSMCFHGHAVCFEDECKPPHVAARPPKRISSLEDLLETNFIGTPTIMFRGREIRQLPDWYSELLIGDWPLHILNAQHGGAGYIDDVMAVQRVHSDGVWSGAGRIQRANAALQMYERLRSHLGPRYQKVIRAHMARSGLALAAAYADEQNTREARRSLWRSVAECPTNALRQPVHVAALALRLYTRPIHAVLKRLWRLPPASV